MKTKPQKTLLERVRTRIARKKGNVFLREDFDDLGGYDQVGRALRQLTAEGVLYRLGYGVYARGYYNSIAKGIIPVEGTITVKQAVERLGITIVPRPSLLKLNADGVQVPNGRKIGVDKPIRRKLGYGNFQLIYEYVKSPDGLQN